MEDFNAVVDKETNNNDIGKYGLGRLNKRKRQRREREREKPR